MDASSLPIDIHCGKLLDWLVSRRHVGKEWNTRVMGIRQEVKLAIEDMPEHEQIVELLSGAHINYFHCKRIVEILRETEADSKNIFGFYSSQRMKDWQQVVKHYEEDNVYLAEAAAVLQRMVLYDVPALHKRVAKAGITAEECVSKTADYARQEKECLRQYTTECKAMGVDAHDGAGVRTQLIRLAGHLPELAGNIAQQVKDMDDAVQYYGKCVAHVTSGNSQPPPLPLLRFVLEKGNPTFYEWHYGRPPTDVVPVDQLGDDANVVVEEEEETIDFGDAIDDEWATEGGGINYGIEVEGDEGLIDQLASASSPTDTVARGEMALTVLEHRQSVQLLVDDLTELSTFLHVRTAMLNTPHASDLLLPSDQLDVRDDVLKCWTRLVDDVLASLTDTNRRHLCKIRCDVAYVDALVAQLDAKRNLAKKYVRLAELAAVRKTEGEEELRRARPDLAALVLQAKQLQKHIETDISRRYSNRSVNIMGTV